MISLFQYQTPPGPCGYLPGRTWRYEHEVVAAITAAEYQERLEQGWRRFGRLLFRPACPACSACRSLRVDVARFRPNRSQRRNRKLNEGIVQLAIGRPVVTREKLDLYDRYHAYQASTKSWPEHGPKDVAGYRDTFTDNPFAVEEWRYTLDGGLVGIGYVDRVPAGLSAIYFFHDPLQRDRGLGTWNVLSVIDRAAKLGLPHVYLGYHVAGAASLEYKANYVPNEARDSDGVWRNFLPDSGR
jgi:arginyl-tRNA--protein-N-Asp/Glu arginylyltransferase